MAFPPGVKVLADGEERVATVRLLAIVAEPEVAGEVEETEEKGEEPERIGRVRKEEEAAGKGKP